MKLIFGAIVMLYVGELFVNTKHNTAKGASTMKKMEAAKKSKEAVIRLMKILREEVLAKSDYSENQKYQKILDEGFNKFVILMQESTSKFNRNLGEQFSE